MQGRKKKKKSSGHVAAYSEKIAWNIARTEKWYLLQLKSFNPFHLAQEVLLVTTT